MDPNDPEQWEQATAPTRDTALRAAGLRTRDDLPPPPTDSDHPPPEVWVTVLEDGHYYVVAATATSPGPKWLIKGRDTMLAPEPPHQGRYGTPPPRIESSGASSSRGTNCRPATWPNPPQGGPATTWDWPCSAWSNGFSAAGHPRGPYPGFEPSPSRTHKSRQAQKCGRTPPQGHSTPSPAGTTPSTGISAA